ncbi:MAG: hypothetical protein JJU37_10335 [Balneolaceae bacterium]|nr:hypothetical protein [Balneolaceae bacterium]
MQETASTAVDTLTSSYSDRWEGLEGIEQSSGFVQFMASNDLIFVVLGVSLIIWFVLLFYLIKVDRNVSKLEELIKDSSDEA